MPDKLKVGIVGCGGVATMRHIPAFMRLKSRVNIQAVCDKNESLAKEAANRYHIPEAYSDFSHMLSKERLDIVDICTPPQIHTPLTLEAIENSCHVILEKPMALKTSDCDEMINASHKHNVKLCVVHNQLFYPPIIRARRLVGEGAIGDFIGMRILKSDPRDEMLLRKDYWIHKLPGGLIGETVPHVIYQSLAFIGTVKEVDVYARNFLEHPWAPFDEFRIEFEGEKGNSSIVISYPSNRRACSIDLLGTEGALHLDLVNMLLIHYGSDKSMKPTALARYSLSTASQIIGGMLKNTFEVLARRAKLAHDVVIEEFVNSILNDHEPPVTGEEGRETTKVVEMVVERLGEKYADHYSHQK